MNRVDWCLLVFGLLRGSLGTLREIMYGVVVMEAYQKAVRELNTRVWVFAFYRFNLSLLVESPMLMRECCGLHLVSLFPF